MSNQISECKLRSSTAWAWSGTILLMMLLAASLQAQTEVGNVPKLLEDLNSKDPAVRGAAATALDNLGYPAAVPMLVSALHDARESGPSCQVLVRTLGRFNGPRAIAALAEQIKGDAGALASEQLLKMGQSGIQAVVDATASEDETTRANVRESLTSVPDLSLKVLPPALKGSKSVTQRSTIVSVLADSAAENPWYEEPPRHDFVEGFLPAASDVSPVVRIAVASAIQQLAGMEKALADTRSGPPDFGLSRALPALKSLADDRDSQVRVAAMDALGAMGGTDAISILKTHANDPDGMVKEHAAIGLLPPDALLGATVAPPTTAAPLTSENHAVLLPGFP